MSTSKSHKETKHSCARVSRRVIAAPVVADSIPMFRQLSEADAAFLVQQLVKPKKANATLRAAARKYWDLV